MLGSVSAWVDEDVTVIHADIIFLNMFTRPEVIFAEVFLHLVALNQVLILLRDLPLDSTNLFEPSLPTECFK